MSLPHVRASSEACLDVTERNLVLTVAGKYKLELDLPYPVDPAKGKAKFLKTASKLQITLPTVSPTIQMKTVEKALDSKECASDGGESPSSNVTVQPVAEEHRGDESPESTIEYAEPNMNKDVGECERSILGEPFQREDGEKICTENQRKWIEIHKNKSEDDDKLRESPNSETQPTVDTKLNVDKGETILDVKKEQRIQDMHREDTGNSVNRTWKQAGILVL